MRLATSFLMLVLSGWPAAGKDFFYGTFLCDFIKDDSSAKEGFDVGDQIFVAVNEIGLSWSSYLGGGLRYNCSRTGDILVCPLYSPSEALPRNEVPNSIFDMNTKKFIRAVAIWHEEWQCKRFELKRRPSKIRPSIPY
jgi:hypothetical protein